MHTYAETRARTAFCVELAITMRNLVAHALLLWPALAAVVSLFSTLTELQ